MAATQAARAQGQAGADGRLFRWLALGLVLVGVAGRLLRYFLRFPIWGDESFVAVNFLTRDYAGLTRQLEYGQVAPVLFLWSELAAFRLLGSSELALRLLPLLAGLASLALFWRLAWRSLRPPAAALAVGFLAVARWPVSMSTFVKPYSFDLFFSLALLVPAVEWLRAPGRLRWLLLLAAVAPLALLGSYPAAFVAGAVGLVLLPVAWRAGWAARLAFGLFGALAAAGLAGGYLVGKSQLGPPTGWVDNYLRSYWAHGFPPAGAWPLLKWLAATHTGRMVAYPFGDGNGGSVLTFLLCVVGGVWQWRHGGDRRLLALWLTPFGLGIVAAFLGKYPYGACCRLSQHVAPAVCLLAGAGLAALLERARAGRAAAAPLCVACGALAVCGLGGMAADAVRPYRDRDALWVRGVADELKAHVGPADVVVVLEPQEQVWSLVRWYLPQRLGDRVTWAGDVDWRRLRERGGRAWLVSYSQDGPGPGRDEARACLARGGDGWEAGPEITYSMRPEKPRDALLYFRLFPCFPREAGPPDLVFSLWP
jgi:hypothetical protein